MTGRRRWPGAAPVVLALALAACTSASSSSHARPEAAPVQASEAADVPPCPELDRVPPREDGLPPLELPCLGNGPAVRLSDLRGVPTVVNVWAAWCVNCDREMPLFARAVRRAGEDVRFLGIHYKASRAHGLRSQEDFGVPFPSVHDEDGDRVALRLRTTAPPQTLFVREDGSVAGRKVGEITSLGEMSRLLEEHLGVRL